MRKPLVPFLAVLLSLSLTPAGATTFGPEVPVSPPSYAAAFGSQVSEAVASDGDSYVALWTEQSYERQGLYSSGVDANGTVHPTPSNLLRSGDEHGASIVWTGDHYLATWAEGGLAPMFAAPIGRDGRISGDIQQVAAASISSMSHSLAWNGSHAFLAYATPSALTGAVLDAAGHVLHTVTLPAASSSVYSVAAVGSTFAIVWAETQYPFAKTNVYFQRFDDAGAAIDAQPVTLESDLPVLYPKVGMAGSASQFGLAYLTTAGGSTERVRIDAATAAIDRLPVTLLTPSLDGVFWSGHDFVAYGNFSHWLETLPFTSVVYNVNVSPSPISRTVIAGGGSSSLAIWIDSRDPESPGHIFGALLDRDATTVARGDLPLSVSALPQVDPALAVSPGGALVVWNRNRSSSNSAADIVARRLDAAGNPLGDPLTLATDVPDLQASVSWLGHVYLAVWAQYGGSRYVIAGKRISASGEVLDDSPIIFAAGSGPVAVSNGTTSLLAFANDNQVDILRLNADGVALDSQPVVIASRPGYNLAAAGNDTEFVVLWTEGSSSLQFLPNLRDIYGVRISATGQPIDAAPIAIGSGRRDQANPAVASDGSDFLIAYTDGGDVAVKKLLREGTLASVTSEDEGTVLGGEANFPRVAFIGMRYVITWSHYVSGQWTALAASTDPNGAVLEQGVEIARSDSLFPIQTALGAFHDTGLVAYSRGNAGDEGIPRLFTRQVVSAQPRERAVRH